MNDRKRMAANIYKLYGLRFLFWTHFFAAVLVPFLRDWGGATYAQVFYLNAWFMIWSFLLEVPTGTIADYFGRRVSLALGPLVAIAGALVYTSSPHLGVFLLAEALFALAFTLMSGADEALAYDSLKAIDEEHRGREVLTRLEACKLAGIIVGALSGGLIAQYGGLAAPLRAQVLPLLLGCVVAATLHEAPGGSPRQHGASYRDTLRSGLRYFRGHAALRALAFDMVGVAALTWMIIWLYQPVLEGVGVPLPWFGVVHATMTVGQIFVLTRIGLWERLLGSQQRYLKATAVVPGLCFVLLAVSSSVWVTVPTIVLIAAFGISRNAVFGSYMNAHIPSAQRATVLSAISMLRTFGTAMMNLIVGNLAEVSIPLALGVVGVGIVVVAMWGGVSEEELNA